MGGRRAPLLVFLTLFLRSVGKGKKRRERNDFLLLVDFKGSNIRVHANGMKKRDRKKKEDKWGGEGKKLVYSLPFPLPPSQISALGPRGEKSERWGKGKKGGNQIFSLPFPDNLL